MLHCNIHRRIYLGGIERHGTPLFMSKQLAISAAASVFAMVVCVLLATPAPNEAGALDNAAAPAVGEAVVDLPSLIR